MPTPPAYRLASLVPSLTELLVALGLGPWLVARTGFCIHPAEALAVVPKVGGTKDVNLIKLKRLAPTHVLLNPDENTRETADALAEAGLQVIVVHPQGPTDLPALLDTLVQHFGSLPEVAVRAQALKAELAQALAEVAASAGLQPAAKVLYLIWRDPWMTVAQDTYISRLIQAAGGQTWPALQGGATGAGRYPAFQGDEAWLAEVDAVWLSSEPYRFGAEDLAAAQALSPRAQVRLVDGELLSWWGPRAPEGLRYAARCLGEISRH